LKPISGAEIFFDTSVLLYLLSADVAKADRAEAVLAQSPGHGPCRVPNGCRILCSEDLQHGQLIEDQLTVIDPFRLSGAAKPYFKAFAVFSGSCLQSSSLSDLTMDGR